MIGMGATFSKHHVYQARTPAYMQGLKTFFTLICNLVAFTLDGTVIIQHHGVNAQFYDPGLRYLESQYKQLVKYLVEYKIGNKGELSEKALDLMGGSHLIRLAFQ